MGEWLAIIMFAVFLVAILSGYPVAFSFAGTGVLFFADMQGRLPGPLAMLLKAIVMMEGVGLQIDPSLG